MPETHHLHSFGLSLVVKNPPVCQKLDVPDPLSLRNSVLLCGSQSWEYFVHYSEHMFIHYQCLKSRWNFLQCCTAVDDETNGLWWHLDFVIVSVYLELYWLGHTCRVSSFTCWSGHPLHFNDNLQQCQTCNTCGGTRMLLELCRSSYDSHYSRHCFCYPLIYHVELLLNANSSQ